MQYNRQSFETEQILNSFSNFKTGASNLAGMPVLKLELLNRPLHNGQEQISKVEL